MKSLWIDSSKFLVDLVPIGEGDLAINATAYYAQNINVQSH